MKLISFILLGAMAMAAPLANAVSANSKKPTIVLVHGAFAESSSWNDVISILSQKGYPVVAAANPLRGVQSDAAAVSSVVAGIGGPVVLVGHSYGGSVISNVAAKPDQIKALVYVAAFAPEAGETAAGLSGKFPGSTLGEALAPAVPLSAGGADLYIRAERFHQQFAADVSGPVAQLMAATQRPITDAALKEPSGEPIWKSIPSWHIYGDQDRNIPAEALAFVAQRANSRETVVLQGGSHVVMVSQPAKVAALIEHAAQGGR